MNSVVENILPEGWKYVQLSDLSEYINGYAFKSKDWSNKGLPIIRIQNLNGKDEYNYFESEIKEKYKVFNGDILISWSASLDVYYWQGGDAVLNQHIFNTKINTEIITKEFFYHTIKYSLAEISRNLHGMGLKHITKGKFERILSPLPPIEEQKRIVAKIDTLFDKIDKAIRLTEESLKQAKNLLPSVLKEALEKGKADGWEEKKLGEVFKDISSGFACSKRFEKDGGYVHLRTHNISTNGVLNFDKIIEIEESKVNVRSSKIFKGDVIFNNTNSTELVGKTSYVDRDYDFGYSNHLTMIKTSEESEGKYLTYFLNHLQFTGYFMRICKKWIGQSGINTSMLKDLNYCYPPLEEQKKLVSMLDGISNQSIKTQSKLEEQLAYLKQLKSSILSKAFKGEL